MEKVVEGLRRVIARAEARPRAEGALQGVQSMKVGILQGCFSTQLILISIGSPVSLEPLCGSLAQRTQQACGLSLLAR